MRKIKKIIKISVTVLCIAIAGIVCAYFGYASTLINPDSEKSLNKHLGVSNDSIITVLAQEKYNNYLGIYYTDSNGEEGISNFVYLEENKLCKGRYKIRGGGSGNTSVKAQCVRSNDNNSDEAPFYFIYGQNVADNICTVFECDENGYFTKKINEISVADNPFVIAETYNLSNDNSDIFILEGKVTEKDVAQMMETNNQWTAAWKI